MNKKGAISKNKGVQMCADLLFSGKRASEIVREFAEKYELSQSAIEKWIKAARVIVAERDRELEEHTMELIKETRQDIVKRLGLDMESVLSQYKKIAFFNIKSIFTEEGGMMNVKDMDDDSAAAIAGIESFDERMPESELILGTVRKIKISEKKTALDSICRVLGYDAATKTELKLELKPITGMIIK